MSRIEEVRVPDIGEFDNIPVIDVLVGVGDEVSVDQALVTLESDKASMDVPSPVAGTVVTLDVSLGDEISQGALILTLRTGDEAAQPVVEMVSESVSEPKSLDQDEPPTHQLEVRVPDIGDFTDVPVIEIMVAAGDDVESDDPLVTLESDKASMDMPSPAAGVVAKLYVSVGDTLSEGDLIVTLETTADAAAMTASKDSPPATEHPAEPALKPKTESTQPAPAQPATPRPAPTTALAKPSPERAKKLHATPSVRRFARKLGVDLTLVVGTGRKGRITNEDVRQFVKQTLSGGTKNPGSAIPEMPHVDFSKFGDIEIKPLSHIKRLSGTNLHRAWLVVPHVTHHDEADITELEAFRKQELEATKQKGVRLTPLAFIMKACVAALQAFPTVNASLEPSGENLILKHYYHLGVAVDTSDGLLVPVVKDVDQKSVLELAKELGELSERARAKKLFPADLKGACFTISSLGGIGGTGFTPIVNAPEVAILGVARSRMKPVYDAGEFIPRLMLPLSLSYDHRVIDGALAARFCRHLCEHLSDIRRLLL